MEKEIWKSVVGWEGLYVVSNIGNVMSLDRKSYHKKLKKEISLKGKKLKPSFESGGYAQVVLCKDGKCVTKKIHRIVAITFLDNSKNLPAVNHINGDIKDNRIENLEWCTLKYNSEHSYRVLGRIPINGQFHSKAKLTETQVIEIRNKYIPYKYSFKKLGDEYGVDASTISLIIYGKNWKYLK